MIDLDSNSNSTDYKTEMSNKEEFCTKTPRKVPYSKNDFLSDSSDIENDVEIVEPLSLKDRLLGKQMISSNGSLSGIIDTNSAAKKIRRLFI